MLTTCQPEWKESLRWLTIVVKSAIGISKSMSSYTRISTQFYWDLLNMDMLVLMLGQKSDTSLRVSRPPLSIQLK